MVSMICDIRVDILKKEYRENNSDIYPLAEQSQILKNKRSCHEVPSHFSSFEILDSTPSFSLISKIKSP